MKIRSEILKKQYIKINKTENWFFEEVSKLDKPLAKLIMMKKKIKEGIDY